ncbi:MAG: chorismate lyase [Magnetococcales bacterium]|nr:chorismate lyase [Magnetococcales bacterium]
MEPHFVMQPLHGWLVPEEYFAAFGKPVRKQLCAALSCRDSLTRYLEQSGQKPVRIRVQKQAYHTIDDSDNFMWAAQQTLPIGTTILSRSAWLLQQEREQLFAYSEVVMAQLTEAARNALELGDEPLGSLFLERDGLVQRSDVQIAECRIDHPALPFTTEGQQTYWCRRSLFQVNQKIRARILEIFLPECCHGPLD